MGHVFRGDDFDGFSGRQVEDITVANIVRWLRSQNWNDMRDEHGDPFEGDYEDVARELAKAILRREWAR